MIFADNCAACHGDDAKGNRQLGRAEPYDEDRLDGSDMSDLLTTITYARNSTTPAWSKRLDPVTTKALAVRRTVSAAVRAETSRKPPLMVRSTRRRRRST